MPFVKFEADRPSKPAVKISGSTITIAEDAWSAAGLGEAGFINLWWDSATHQIGITATGHEDKSKFPLRKSRRGVSFGAKKFFDKLGIHGAQPVNGLKEIGGVTAFAVTVPGATVPGAAPRRRGRPKSVPSA
jgi:hypothetical protein